ncbi:MAG: class I SAM-dependent methyltransferase [Aristaeellaceae bacterium]
MSKRVDLIRTFYIGTDEDSRLERSRHGQLEYATTMHYIRRYAKPGCRVLEIGAGTGRYAIALAKAGYEVTALELVAHNLDILRANAADLPRLNACQGDALDLSRFADDSFDVTLVFGPLYHLYAEEDVHRALDEALRVTRTGGVMLTAFLSVYAILYDNYLNDRLAEGLAENYDGAQRVRHFEEQLFTGYDIAGFEALFAGKNAEHLVTAAADGILELAEGREDFSMSDEAFAAFTRHHLATCEKRELLGCSSHLLHICRKGIAHGNHN